MYMMVVGVCLCRCRIVAVAVIFGDYDMVLDLKMRLKEAADPHTYTPPDTFQKALDIPF